jgi:hypothetical protein
MLADMTKDDLLSDVVTGRDAGTRHDCEAMLVGQGPTFKIADPDDWPADEARAAASRRQMNCAAGMSVWLMRRGCTSRRKESARSPAIPARRGPLQPPPWTGPVPWRGGQASDDRTDGGEGPRICLECAQPHGGSRAQNFGPYGFPIGIKIALTCEGLADNA